MAGSGAPASGNLIFQSIPRIFKRHCVNGWQAARSGDLPRINEHWPGRDLDPAGELGGVQVDAHVATGGAQNGRSVAGYLTLREAPAGTLTVIDTTVSDNTADTAA